MMSRPSASDAGVAARMRRQREHDTFPELMVRRALFARGLRYRKHFPVPSPTRRSIDIAFTGARLAVFIDGCIWHGCREHLSPPSANGHWWQGMLDENRRRDLDTDQVLIDLVLRFWEHDDLEVAARTVIERLKSLGAVHG
jgi:DNA mismatch endonuclease (patch repair protein)